MCVVTKNNRVYTKAHKCISGFNLMAWGSSGGNKESRRNQAARNLVLEGRIGETVEQLEYAA